MTWAWVLRSAQVAITIGFLVLCGYFIACAMRGTPTVLDRVAPRHGYRDGNDADAWGFRLLAAAVALLVACLIGLAGALR